MMNYSPLRYPGGKARLSPFIKLLIEKTAIQNPVYIEPYAGGAGVALSLLIDDVVDARQDICHGHFTENAGVAHVCFLRFIRRTRQADSVFIHEACPAVLYKTLRPFGPSWFVHVTRFIDNFNVFVHGCHPLLST